MRSAIFRASLKVVSERPLLSLDSVVVTSVVRPEDLLASHRHTWSVLCQKQADLASPFYSLAFAQAVARAGPTVRVCVIEEAGSAPAFFPLSVS